MRRVRPDPLHDGQGKDCLHVDLPPHVDERVGAEIVLQVFRCLHLHAVPGTTYTTLGLRQIAYRSRHRSIVTVDDLPPDMRDDYMRELIRVLDWASGTAA